MPPHARHFSIVSNTSVRSGRKPALSIISTGYFDNSKLDEIAEKAAAAESEVHSVEIVTSWRSIYILSALCLFSGVQFSVFFGSLWPYLSTVDPTASPSFFGIITGGFSLGQAIASPFFGFWMNRAKTVRWPLCAGILVMIFSNLVYCFTESFHGSQRRYVMLVARFFIGTGAGTIGVMRAYAATASTVADRARAITLVAASYVIGMIIGPGVQLAFTPIDYPGLHIGPLHIDMYTAPAWFASLVSGLSLIPLFTMLDENYAGIENKEINTDRFFALPKFDRIAAGICIMTQFSMMLIITQMETIGSIYSIMMWDWSNAKTTVQGVVSFALYLLFALKLGAYVNQGRERITTIIGLSMALSYHLITFPWPFYSGHVENYLLNVSGEDKPEKIGCDPERYSWCSSTHVVNVWLYWSSSLIQSAAWPFMNVPMNTLYSKILGPRRQGTMQGLQLMVGSLARTLGPAVVAALFDNFGPSVTWGMEIMVLTATIFAWIVFYRRLVPLNTDPQLKPGEFYAYKNGYKYRF